MPSTQIDAAFEGPLAYEQPVWGQELTLLLLNTGGDPSVSLRQTLHHAGIRLQDETSQRIVDGWLWTPRGDDQAERRWLENWFRTNETKGHQQARLVCWLPRNPATPNSLPDWLQDVPPDRLYISRAENPARLANELKHWFRRSRVAETPPLPEEWLWLVHPEDERRDLALFRHFQQHCSVQRIVLDTEAARKLHSPEWTQTLAQIPGLLIYSGESSDWAASIAAQLWRHTRQQRLRPLIHILADLAYRRNQFISIGLPGSSVLHLDPTCLPTNPLQGLETNPNSPPCPYIGLRPYDERDSPYFLGRDHSIEQVLHLLQQNHYVYITGASGDGKSSLVYAGLVPAMKSGFLTPASARWAVAAFRPEGNPLRSLSRALHQALNPGMTVEAVEECLSSGFSALVDLYKQAQESKDPSRRSSCLLLVLDQMEELFTHAENYAQGQLSTSAYTTATLLADTIERARAEGLPIYTLFTLRSDYLGECARLPGFNEQVGRSVFFIPPLPQHELESIIQLPAEMVGRSLSPRLLRQLLLEADGCRDSLSVLQHALNQIWREAGTEEILDVPHFNRAAGLPLPPAGESSNRLQAVLNHHAETLCSQLEAMTSSWPVSERLNAEQTARLVEVMFRSLIRFDGSNVVRRPVALSELCSRIEELSLTRPQVVQALDLFRHPDHTFIRPYAGASPDSNDLEPHTLIDLTHEALIRNWNRLESWAQDEVRDVSRLRELKAQTDRWNHKRRSSRHLLSPGMATYFQRWLDETRPHPMWIASHLYSMGDVAAEEGAAKAEQDLVAMRDLVRLSLRRHERSRRLGLIALSIIGALGVLSAFLYWSYYHETEESLAKSRQIIRQERDLAEKQRIINANLAREAENSRLLSEQQRLIAEQKLLQEEQRRKQAMGQAMAAEKIARLAEIEREMAHREKAIADNLRKTAEEQKMLSDRQATLERETAERARRSAQVASEERKNAERQRNEALLFQSRYMAAMAQKQAQARKYEVALLLSLKALPTNVAQPDRPYEPLAEASLYQAAHHMVNETPYPVLAGHKNVVTSALFLPDGNQLVTTSQDRTARGWDLKTGRQLFSFTHGNIVRRVEISADGRYLLAVSDDYAVHVWDLSKRQLVRAIGNETELIRIGRISSDGRWVATVSGAGTTKVWDRSTGHLMLEVKAQSSVRSLTFSPNSAALLVCTVDHGVYCMDLNSGKTISQLQGHKGVNRAVFAPNLSSVVTVSDDQQVRIWDWRKGQLLHKLFGHSGPVVDVCYAQNGRWFVTVSADGTARIWSPEGQELAVLADAGGPFAQALVSSDSERIATLNSSRQLRLWDGRSFLALASFDEKPMPGFGFSFHPSGRSIALAGYDFRARVYKVLPSGQELITFSQSNLKKRDLTETELSQYLNK